MLSLMSGQCLHLSAPAKINLALSVGPPEPAGLHPIASWMVTVDLCDELELTALPADRLSRYAILWHPDARRRGDIDWSITRDLAVRAHLALERYTGRTLPLQLKLEKRIPLGGGLGGGSSDAAAMLRGVNALFDLQLSDRVLEGLAASLGSDVPFLVHGGSALVTGTGEQLDRHADMPVAHLVLAFPEVACETARVYQRFDALDPSPLDPGRVAGLRRDVVDGGQLFNDLAAPALDLAPSLADQYRQLETLSGHPVHVSGSGSTLFVVCGTQLEAAALVEAVESKTGLVAVAVGAAPPEVGMVRNSPTSPESA